MERYIIIVAGGQGLRMGGDVPKQFLLLSGRPVLMRTMENFYTCDPQIRQILVLPAGQLDYWHELCGRHSFAVPHQVAAGGETRFHSVKSGLAFVPEEEALVGVHDGVRPFVSHDVIKRCYEEAADKKAIVPVTDVVDTVRRLDGKGSRTVNRNDYKLVQTPQVFDAGLLKSAYRQPYMPEFTDDASVVEALGIEVSLVQGNRENIKMTTPFDLTVGKAILECSI